MSRRSAASAVKVTRMTSVPLTCSTTAGSEVASSTAVPPHAARSRGTTRSAAAIHRLPRRLIPAAPRWASPSQRLHRRFRTRRSSRRSVRSVSRLTLGRAAEPEPQVQDRQHEEVERDRGDQPAHEHHGHRVQQLEARLAAHDQDRARRPAPSPARSSRPAQAVRALPRRTRLAPNASPSSCSS